MLSNATGQMGLPKAVLRSHDQDHAQHRGGGVANAKNGASRAVDRGDEEEGHLDIDHRAAGLRHHRGHEHEGRAPAEERDGIVAVTPGDHVQREHQPRQRQGIANLDQGLVGEDHEPQREGLAQARIAVDALDHHARRQAHHAKALVLQSKTDDGLVVEEAVPRIGGREGCEQRRDDDQERGAREGEHDEAPGAKREAERVERQTQERGGEVANRAGVRGGRAAARGEAERRGGGGERGCGDQRGAELIGVPEREDGGADEGDEDGSPEDPGLGASLRLGAEGNPERGERGERRQCEEE